MHEKTWYSEKWVGRQASFSLSRYVKCVGAGSLTRAMVQAPTHVHGCKLPPTCLGSWVQFPSHVCGCTHFLVPLTNIIIHGTLKVFAIFYVFSKVLSGPFAGNMWPTLLEFSRACLPPSPTDWDRVNWSVEIWGEAISPCPPVPTILHIHTYYMNEQTINTILLVNECIFRKLLFVACNFGACGS